MRIWSALLIWLSHTRSRSIEGQHWDFFLNHSVLPHWYSRKFHLENHCFDDEQVGRKERGEAVKGRAVSSRPLTLKFQYFRPSHALLLSGWTILACMMSENFVPPIFQNFQPTGHLEVRQNFGNLSKWSYDKYCQPKVTEWVYCRSTKNIKEINK